jgi:hypothetical protein
MARQYHKREYAVITPFQRNPFGCKRPHPVIAYSWGGALNLVACPVIS